MIKPMSKKGFNLTEVPQLVIVLLVIAIVLGVGSTVLTQMQDDPAPVYHYEQNTSDYGALDYTLWYRLDLNQTTAKDVTNNHNGTNYGDTYTTSGLSLNARVFDGSNDYINISTSPLLKMNNTNYTVLLWYKSAATTTVGRDTLIGDRNTGSPYTGYELNLEATGKIRAYVYSSEACTVTSDAAYNNAQWHLVGFKFNTGTKVLTLLTDGVEKTVTCAGTNVYGNVKRMLVGASTIAGQLTNGTIDEVRIYRRDLTTAEVAEFYESAPLDYNVTYLNQTTYSYSSQYNVTEQGLQGQTDLSEWQTTWVVIVAAAVILGIIYRYLMMA